MKLNMTYIKMLLQTDFEVHRDTIYADIQELRECINNPGGIIPFNETNHKIEMLVDNFDRIMTAVETFMYIEDMDNNNE